MLELAEPADILFVLRHSHALWASGLTLQDYVLTHVRQLQDPWGRRNFRFFVLRKHGEVVAGCKLYTLDFQERGRRYKIGGVGAVFTIPSRRGHGYATEMLEHLIEQATAEAFDGLWLFSDIEPEFYERLGFELLPDDDFHVWTNTSEFEKWVKAQPQSQCRASAITTDLSETLASHYMRYLVSLPYGLSRSKEYFRARLKRVLFRAERVSQCSQLELITLPEEQGAGGYAIFEEGDGIIRVLEAVGNADAREALWRNIFTTALARDIELVRGWAVCAPDVPRQVRYVERGHTLPMLLPINDAVSHWLDLETCPVLELDHF